MEKNELLDGGVASACRAGARTTLARYTQCTHLVVDWLVQGIGPLAREALSKGNSTQGPVTLKGPLSVLLAIVMDTLKWNHGLAGGTLLDGATRTALFPTSILVMAMLSGQRKLIGPRKLLTGPGAMKGPAGSTSGAEREREREEEEFVQQKATKFQLTMASTHYD